MERIVKGVFIPIEIWQAEDLCWNEKILLMEVDSFTSKGRDCYFSNQYIADLLGVSEDSASRLVNALIRKGYLRLARFDGRHRFLETCIEVRCRVVTDDEAGSAQMPRQGRQERRGSSIMNKINKPSNSVARFARPTLEQVQAYCSERGNGIDAAAFLDYYESKGWKVGGAPMKDWKAAVRTWERRRKATATEGKAQVATDVNKFWI